VQRSPRSCPAELQVAVGVVGLKEKKPVPGILRHLQRTLDRYVSLGVSSLVMVTCFLYSFYFSLSGRHKAYTKKPTPHSTRSTPGGLQVPLRIEGGASFGQYMRNIGMKSPVGAGSQLASLSLPGDSFWK